MKSLFVFGRYETPERHAVRCLIDPDRPVVELGASIGVVACITNKRLRSPDKHVVVEANPDLLPLLERNRDLNRCKFTVLNRAVAYGRDEVPFNRGAFWGGNILGVWGTNESPVPVKTVTLKGILDTWSFDRCTVICDIEGAEFQMIESELETLSERVAWLILEVHDQIDARAAEGARQRLSQLGFRCVYEEERTSAFQNGRFGPAEGESLGGALSAGGRTGYQGQPPGWSVQIKARNLPLSDRRDDVFAHR
jgi:FkbM family methyltransferase